MCVPIDRIVCTNNLHTTLVQKPKKGPKMLIPKSNKFNFYMFVLNGILDVTYHTQVYINTLSLHGNNKDHIVHNIVCIESKAKRQTQPETTIYRKLQKYHTIGIERIHNTIISRIFINK